MQRLPNRTEGPIVPGTGTAGHEIPVPPGRTDALRVEAPGRAQRVPGESGRLSAGTEQSPVASPLVPFTRHATPWAVTAPLPTMTPPGPHGRRCPAHLQLLGAGRAGTATTAARAAPGAAAAAGPEPVSFLPPRLRRPLPLPPPAWPSQRGASTANRKGAHRALLLIDSLFNLSKSTSDLPPASLLASTLIDSVFNQSAV